MRSGLMAAVSRAARPSGFAAAARPYKSPRGRAPPRVASFPPASTERAAMRLSAVSACAAALLAVSGAALASSLDADIGTGTRIEFTSQVVHDTKIRAIKNSGVCETTPGVNQISGYLDVGTNMSMVCLLSITLFEG